MEELFETPEIEKIRQNCYVCDYYYQQMKDLLLSKKGLRGDEGEKGNKGKNDYQLWLESGSEGTLNDFFESGFIEP